MRTIVLFSLFLTMAGAPGLSEGQSASARTPQTELSADLEQYRSQRLREKIYVHTDKDIYLAGEICWFKVYDVDATLHHPLDLSKVAYLEWIDKSGKAVLQAKIGLHNGRGNGSVSLPSTLLSGNYILRAYTAWMKNYDAVWFFERAITVINDRKPAQTSISDSAPRYAVTFFPEGGYMVENLPGKVAFRVADQFGRGIDCSGIVTEDDADTVVGFHPLRFGIGTFLLNPRTGHRYRATIRLADGTAIDKLLPAARKEGFTMSVSKEDAGHIRVAVRRSPQATEGEASLIYMIAQTRQSVRIAIAGALHEGTCSFILSRDSLGEGISQLTLFDAGRHPVCERLVFKIPSRRLQIRIGSDKTVYTTREKIAIHLDLEGKEDRPGASDCSVSVFRLDSLGKVPQGHIDSYLWLSSDLAGGIESPDYYFEHPGDEEAADNLMMTHGWRRFRWDEVLRHSTPSFDFIPEYKGAIIMGKVVDPQTGKGGSGIQSYLSVPGTRTQFTTSLSDGEGVVKFEMPDFYGGRQIVVQTSPSTDRVYNMDIANPFSEEKTYTPLLPFAMEQSSGQTLSDRSVAVQVVNRFGGERLRRFDPPPVDTTAFYIKPDEKYLLDDYTRFTTMEEVQREYVQLILVLRRGGHFHVPVFDLAHARSFDGDPLILLDGVPVFNIDTLMTLDPLKMRRLDIMNRRFFLGSTSFPGIMNWITYKGDLAGYPLDPHATVIDYEGLQLQREFYSPVYATPEQAASHLPDFRNVLYWSPSVMTNPGSGVSVNFYSSDLPGKYAVIAEGLAADGTAGSGYAEFEVK
ncbi:MAG: hypothetical protein Q8937_00210 [Bacteroidota bacterium]|nr:hypothetical protein [Bacteroidota bacterium]